jgi:GNAT superfamily N-acetyltransferase
MNTQAQVNIRPYDVKDFAQLCHLVAEFYSIHRHFTGSAPIPPEEAASIIQQDMLRDESYILVAEPIAGGDLIGFCRYENHEGAFFGRELLVVENWRIRGVGTKLLHAVEDEIKKAGETNLYLSIVPRNIEALRFFVRRGYNILNTIELRAEWPQEKVQRKPIHFLGLQFRC